MKGYPTLKWFWKGKVVDYASARTQEALVKFASDKVAAEAENTPTPPVVVSDDVPPSVPTPPPTPPVVPEEVSKSSDSVASLSSSDFKQLDSQVPWLIELLFFIYVSYIYARYLLFSIRGALPPSFAPWLVSHLSVFLFIHCHLDLSSSFFSFFSTRRCSVCCSILFLLCCAVFQSSYSTALSETDAHL